MSKETIRKIIEIILIAVAFVGLVLLLKYTDVEELDPSDKTTCLVSIQAYADDEVILSKGVEVPEGESLMGALVKCGSFYFEDDYSPMVVQIKDIEQDKTHFWLFEVDGSFSDLGVKDYKITHDTVVTWTYTDIGEFTW